MTRERGRGDAVRRCTISVGSVSERTDGRSVVFRRPALRGYEMPMYEYRAKDLGKAVIPAERFEVKQSMSEEPLATCRMRHCGGAADLTVHGLHTRRPDRP